MKPLTGKIKDDCNFTKKNKGAGGKDPTAYLARRKKNKTIKGYWNHNAHVSECKSLTVEEYEETKKREKEEYLSMDNFLARMDPD